MGWRVRGFLVGILLIGTLLRLRGIDNPLLDDQGWRQADTASMALNMLGHLGDFPDVFFPLLNYDGIGPQKVELEFPFLPYLLALSWTALGWSDLWGRIWAILFSLATIWGIFEFGRRAFSLQTGIIAALFYSVLPLAVYYGRVVMPEPVSQALSIWALNFTLIWRNDPSKRIFWGSAFLMAAAILAKLPQLMLFPVALCFGFWPFRGKWTTMLKYSLLALLLPMLYYAWVHFGAGEGNQFVSGIISDQVVEGPQLFFALLKQHLGEGMGLSILILAGIGYIRVIGYTLGFSEIRGLRVEQGVLSGVLWGVTLWGLISLFYLVVICLRIPLDYYLVPLILPVVLCAGVALDSVDEIPAGVIGVLVISLLLFNNAFFYESKYSWDERYLTQANWLRENTKKEDIFILSDSPPMTLYYAQRYGVRLIHASDDQAWERLQKLNGDYLVALPASRGTEFWEKVKKRYIEVGPGIFRL